MTKEKIIKQLDELPKAYVAFNKEDREAITSAIALFKSIDEMWKILNDKKLSAYSHDALEILEIVQKYTDVQNLNTN